MPKVEQEHHILGGELGGDALEQAVWPYLKDKFPRYEVLWSEFIWPLTNRIYRTRGSRLDVHHFRPELMGRQPMLIWLAQAHYTVFRCLGSVWFRVYHWTAPSGRDASPAATLENLLHLDRLNDIYRLIGSVDDMVSTMAHAVERLEQAASGQQPPAKRTLDEVRRQVEGWFSSKYDKLFARFNRELRPVSLQIHTRGDSLQRILPQELAGKYSNFRERAAQYRNLLHSPQPAQMWRGDGHWVPKPEYLSEFAHWPKMASVTEDELRSKFQPAEDALKRDAQELAGLLNEVWAVFLERMRKLRETPAFQGWMAQVPETTPEAVHVIYPRSGVIEGATTSAYFPPVGLSGVKMADGLSHGDWSRVQSGMYNGEEKGK